jgi:hypothetical protein
MLAWTRADNHRNGEDAAVADTHTSYTHAWRDNALVSSSSHDGDTDNGSNPLFSSTYAYDGRGRLASVNIADGRARTVSFASSAEGQVLRRAERSASASNPEDQYYFLDGRQVGELTNNGANDPAKLDYARNLEMRNWRSNPQSAPFRWNGSGGVTGGEFGGAGYDYINPTAAASGNGTSYRVQGGESLQQVAASVWGDASLWYKIAEANGLTGSELLAAGTTLRIPAAVTNIHNNAGTFQVYDPNRALGELDPTAPKPQAAQQARQRNQCGMFGALFVTAFGVALSFILPPIAPALGPVVSGALTATTANVLTQGFAVATGIQDKFNWKGVAFAGITGGVVGGLNSLGVFKHLGIHGSSFAAQAAQGALTNGLTQGIAVATGLQGKFDWAGVAAAGIGQGVSSQIRIPGTPGRIVAGAADAIAGAATRSLITGTSFGDNVLAVLPDVIGRSIGLAVADGIAGAVSRPRLAYDKSVFDLGDQVTGGISGAALAAPGVGNGAAAKPMAGVGGGKVGAGTGAMFNGTAPAGAAASAGAGHDPFVLNVVNGGSGNIVDDIFAGASHPGLPEWIINHISKYGPGGVADHFITAAGTTERLQGIAGIVGGVAASDLGAAEVHALLSAQIAADLAPADEIVVTGSRSGARQSPQVRHALGRIAAYEAEHPGSRARWAAERHATQARVDGALRRFDRDAVRGVTLGPRLGAEFALGTGVVNVARRGYTAWRAGRAAQAAESVIPRIGGRLPINSRYAGRVHPSGVRFTAQGFPDFAPFARAEVRITGLSGTYAKDAALANAAAGLARTPRGYVRHHAENGVTMQLIPRSVHNSVRHTGGAAVIRNRGFDQ